MKVKLSNGIQLDVFCDWGGGVDVGINIRGSDGEPIAVKGLDLSLENAKSLILALQAAIQHAEETEAFAEEQHRRLEKAVERSTGLDIETIRQTPLCELPRHQSPKE